MGVVDLGHDPAGNRVAMKRLTLHGSASEIGRSRQRLRREADVLRRLHHPNIVRLLDVVEDGDDIVLVMPYLSGGNLAERVAQHGPAPPADVERLAERLIAALAAAHQAGIIHRDIKPANVLYDSEGEPMLADFGVAHTWDQTPGLTVAGMVVGTPGYISPEQARDEPLTPASDVFSLGATLLFAATGTGPYGSGDPGLLVVRAANEEVERLPKHLPKTMRGWLEPMLDPKPERRPTTAAMLTGQGLPPQRSTLLRPRNIAALAALAAAVVLTVNMVTSNGSTDEASSGLARGASDSETSPSPEALPVLVDQLAGELSQPGEEITVEVPPHPGSDQGCVEPMALELEVTGGVVAALTLMTMDNEPLGREVSRLDQPAVLRLEQPVCPPPGENLRAMITLLAPPSAPPDQPEPLGTYMLTREES